MIWQYFLCKYSMTTKSNGKADNLVRNFLFSNRKLFLLVLAGVYIIMFAETVGYGLTYLLNFIKPEIFVFAINKNVLLLSSFFETGFQHG
jgi:hypothetical protein